MFMVCVTLDTNILIDFLLIQWKEDKKQPITDLLKRSREIKNKYLEKKFTNYVSEWGLLEFRDVVEKLVEERKLIENGYSLSEFSEGRKELPLTLIEIKTINSIVNEVYQYSIMKMPTINLKILRKICQNGFSTFDALLLMHANETEECKYFVTRDKRLIKNAPTIIPFHLSEIKIINRKQALNLF